jgi:hypothetical protein
VLLLDDCEHVIDAAASMAGALLRAQLGGAGAGGQRPGQVLDRFLPATAASLASAAQ